VCNKNLLTIVLGMLSYQQGTILYKWLQKILKMYYLTIYCGNSPVTNNLDHWMFSLPVWTLTCRMTDTFSIHVAYKESIDSFQDYIFNSFPGLCNNYW